MKEKLYEACNTGNLPAVSLMLKHIDLDIPCIETFDSFGLACANGELEIVDLFLSYPSFIKALSGDLEYKKSVVFKIEAYGYSFNSFCEKKVKVSDNNLDILAKASRNGHLAIVERLLSQDYIQAIAGTKNCIVLISALEGGNLELIEWLLKEDVVIRALIANEKLTTQSNPKFSIVRKFILEGNLKVFKSLMSNEQVKNIFSSMNVYYLFNSVKLSSYQLEVIEYFISEVLPSANILTHVKCYIKYAVSYKQKTFLEKLLLIDNVNEYGESFYDSDFLKDIFDNSDLYCSWIINIGTKMIEDNVFRNAMISDLHSTQLDQVLEFLGKVDLNAKEYCSRSTEFKFVINLFKKTGNIKKLEDGLESDFTLKPNSDAIKFLQTPIIHKKLEDALQALHSPEKNRLKTLIGYDELHKPSSLIDINLDSVNSNDKESKIPQAIKSAQPTIMFKSLFIDKQISCNKFNKTKKSWLALKPKNQVPFCSIALKTRHSSAARLMLINLPWVRKLR